MTDNEPPKEVNHACRTCRKELAEDDWKASQDTISGISPEIDCEVCGRPYLFEKIRVHFTVMNEAGKERQMGMTIDWQGDTPLEAINTVLQAHAGTRGERVISIDRIERNTTPPITLEEMGERSVEFEETGVIVHDINLSVRR